MTWSEILGLNDEFSWASCIKLVITVINTLYISKLFKPWHDIKSWRCLGWSVVGLFEII